MSVFQARNKKIVFAYLAKLMIASIVAFLLLSLGLGAVSLIGKVNLLDTSSPLFRITMIVQSLALFLLPMLLYENGRRTIIRAFKRASKRFEDVPTLRFLLFLGVCLGGSSLLSVFSEYIIELLPKSWGIASQDTTAKIVEELLRNHSPLYLVEVFSICILPAIVEELFFRATLQRYMLAGFTRPMLAIFVTALIFSLAHLSLVGLLSRLWIGLVLGYLYYDSQNILLSIRLHFLNNLVALVLLIFSLN